jgi:hypothetical protein
MRRLERHGAPSLQRAAGAALLLTLAVLPACGELALPKEAAPPLGADPAYNELVARHLKTVFKNRGSYDTFDISGFRWVHSVKGWSWLACVRFQDRGHPRTYALFIQDGAVVDDRFAVQTDACDTQTYSPFDAMMGTVPPASIGVQEPLY